MFLLAWLMCSTSTAVSAVTLTDVTSSAGINHTQAVGVRFLGKSENAAHFGLGDSAGTIDAVTIHWPSGIVQKFFNVVLNSTLDAIEAYLPGDLNGDGLVNLEDLNIALSNWNQHIPSTIRLFGDPFAPAATSVSTIATKSWPTGMWAFHRSRHTLVLPSPNPARWHGWVWSRCYVIVSEYKVR